MNLSQGKEDYLKVIFKFNGYNEYVSNKKISQTLEISAASVSDMLSKLAKDGAIEYVAYKGAKLTDIGLDIAISVVRKHRLSECFLYNILGYSLDEVDQDAEQLEHIESDLFFNRLDSFLFIPETCPHGGIIPNKDNMNEIYVESLNECNDDEKVVIKRIIDNTNIIKHLEDSNISIGDILTIKKRDSLNNLILLEKEGEEKYISYNLAEMVFVTPYSEK